MKRPSGGTDMWCPMCEKVTTCKAHDPARFTRQHGQRWKQAGHADIQWFRRGRECLTCHNDFVTAEIDEEFLGELVRLRITLEAIRQNSESYVTQANAAESALKQLNDTLSQFRLVSKTSTAPNS